MRVQELSPGLWRWTGLHPDWSAEEEWAEEVSCAYAESEDAITLIDPLIPPEDPARFLEALDRDVARAGLPVHIVITIFWHARSAAELLERYPGARLWAHEPARELVDERAPVSDSFRAGDTLPGGTVAIDGHRAFEVLFWLPAHRTVATGDVLLGTDDGGLTLCPLEWLGPRDPREVRRGIREAVRDLPVERVLPAHGEPVLEDAAGVLDRALADD